MEPVGMILHNTVQTGCVKRLYVNKTVYLGWTDLLLHRDLLDSDLGPRGVQSTLPARAEVKRGSVCVVCKSERGCGCVCV